MLPVAQAARAEAARLLTLLAVFRLDVAPEAMEPVEGAILGLAADRVVVSCRHISNMCAAADNFMTGYVSPCSQFAGHGGVACFI